MRNKPKWYSAVLLGLALLLFASITACAPSSLSSTPTIQPSSGEEAIPWHEANNHVGEIKVVEGPVVSAMWASGSEGKPTFLNIGKPYPAPDRFTVVIWIDNRVKFTREFSPDPETYFLYKTVRVKGFIDTYKGIPQIQLSDPANIWIVK